MIRTWAKRLALAGFLFTAGLWLTILIMQPRTPARKNPDRALALVAGLCAAPLIPFESLIMSVVRYAPNKWQMNIFAALVILFWTVAGGFIGWIVDRRKAKRT